MKHKNCLNRLLLFTGMATAAVLTTLSGCKDDKEKPAVDNSANEIVKFDIVIDGYADYQEGDEAITVIDAETHSVQITVPWYVDEDLGRFTIEVSTDATYEVTGGDEDNFKKGVVTYTVQAQNGAEKEWKVYVTWLEESAPALDSDPLRPLVSTDKYRVIKFNLWGNAYATGSGVSRSRNPSRPIEGYITNTGNPATDASYHSIYFVARHSGELQMALRGATGNSTGNTINVRVFVNGVQAKDDDGVTDYNHSYLYDKTAETDVLTIHRVVLPEIPEGNVGHQIKIELRGEGARGGSYYYRFYEMWVSGWATRSASGTRYENKPSGLNFSLSTPRDGLAAPSIHMNMAAPQGNMEYFYTEVTVPVGYDPMGVYFMTSGNGQGYAGIQINSTTERRFLFSIWSAAEESDNSTLKNKYNPKLVRVSNQPEYRSGITYKVFGGEGTGGQSYLNVRWVTGNTYKVLTRIRPHPDQTRFPNSTLYKACYYNGTEWIFMCEWRRQEIQPGDKGVTKAAGPFWYTGASHFVEDPAGTRGNLTHMAYYSNHWFITDKGEYVEPTGYTFTGDQAYGRADVAGGVVKNGAFANSIFLKTGGYFTDIEAISNPFKKPNSAVKPDLDLSALNAMGTDDPDADDKISPGEKYEE